MIFELIGGDRAVQTMLVAASSPKHRSAFKILTHERHHCLEIRIKGCLKKDRLVILDVKKKQLYTNLIERQDEKTTP